MPSEALKAGYYIQFVGSHVPGSMKDNFYQIRGVEGFHYETGDSDQAEFSSVASGSSSGYKNIEVLEPDRGPFHMFWITWGVKDGCEYQLKNPTGSDRLGTDEDKDVARINNVISPYYDPDPSFGFYSINNQYPSINASNITPAAVTPKVYFRGEKYDLERVTNTDIIERLQNFDTGAGKALKCKKITLGGIKGS